MKVPFMDVKSEHQPLRADLLKAWEEILDGAEFVGGVRVERFERSFAEFCEVGHAIGVGNGTDALLLALEALGIRAGDEVILPANSFVATAEAVMHAGATPVFADIDPKTYTVDVNQIEAHVTSRTRAVLPVHLYGQPADMAPILEIAARHGLRVIEDCAQAHGARYHGRRVGSIGDVACFSFYPAKNLGACGDGGAVVTNDSATAEKVRKLRDHGGLRKYAHDVVGYNSRLDAMQAAALDLKLKHLERRNAMRRQHASEYDRLLAGVDAIIRPFEPKGINGAYHLYVIRVENGNRGDLQKFLSEHDVQTGIHYPTPIHRTPAFSRFKAQHCPVAEKYSSEILSLPIHPELTGEQVEYVSLLIGKYVEAVTSELMAR